MKPDINNKEHYYCFINDAKTDIDIYTKKLETAILLRDNTYNFLNEHKEIIFKNFNIDLDTYEIEWKNKSYNKEEKLLNKANNTLKKCTNSDDRLIILQLYKYCYSLSNCRKYINAIEFAKDRKNISYKTWEKYISDYYNTVHKCILQGYAYAYSNGIGDLIINRWKTGKVKKPFLDFDATNKKKEEILAAGKELYDDKKAAWYKLRGIKYEAEDYRVYKHDDYYYEITIINSKIVPNTRKQFERTEYVASKIRGLGFKYVAEHCNTIEDIYYIPADIKYKLNCLLHKCPTEYLKFIRNDEQKSFERGAHNSQNRQRFQSR